MTPDFQQNAQIGERPRADAHRNLARAVVGLLGEAPDGTASPRGGPSGRVMLADLYNFTADFSGYRGKLLNGTQDDPNAEIVIRAYKYPAGGAVDVRGYAPTLTPATGPFNPAVRVPVFSVLERGPDNAALLRWYVWSLMSPAATSFATFRVIGYTTGAGGIVQAALTCKRIIDIAAGTEEVGTTTVYVRETSTPAEQTPLAPTGAIQATIPRIALANRITAWQGSTRYGTIAVTGWHKVGDVEKYC